MRNSRVVLVSHKKYTPEFDEFLLSLLGKGYILFCVVGIDCTKWEDNIDELAIGDGLNSIFVTTTSHPDESVNEVNEVIEFAKMLTLSEKSDVDIIDI